MAEAPAQYKPFWLLIEAASLLGNISDHFDTLSDAGLFTPRTRELWRQIDDLRQRIAAHADQEPA